MNVSDLAFLPEEVLNALQNVDMDKLCEIRLRNHAPVVVNYDFKRLYLGKDKLTLDEKNAVFCDETQIANLVFKASEYSVYAVNESLKGGFVTTSCGVRIGICGECVFEGDKIITIKNFTSVCIRIPHFIIGAAENLLKKLNGVYNTLIVSAPGYGKTTILKDIARIWAKSMNVLLIDERGELSDEHIRGADIVRYCGKLYAFRYGIRSLAPQVVLTDELLGERDWECVEQAVSCGVKTVATLHGSSLEDVLKKPEFKKGLFERYCVLRSTGRAGVIDKIYDENLSELR